ncbi:MAG: FAD-dependent oxidoreductase [Endozoicomonas sp.]|uniref:FAD-dependent oxidoreductase n=1 Tax=Endozoicomonas sp. TaxID=1892382 RepID=UPI003D9B6C08
MKPDSVPQTEAEKIVIVGAGPAGLLLAHYLLQRGNCRITLFDKLTDPDEQVLISQRTFPISLQSRGLEALRPIPGLENKVIQSGTWSQGTLLYTKGGVRKIPARSPLLLTHRNRLTQILLSELRSQYSRDQFTIEFKARCTDLNDQEQWVRLENKQGEQRTEYYDKLVAADGAHSAIRKLLAQRQHLSSSLKEVPNVYRNLTIQCSMERQMQAVSAEHIHVWNLGRKARLMVVPQGEDILRGTLISPHDQDPLDAFQSAEDLQSFLQKKCPELSSLIDLTAARQLFNQPVARNLTVHCDRMHSGKNILLLGDAVHAVSASIGQGCNASLQDVMVFIRILQECHGDWATALETLTQRHLPNAHALRELSDYSYPQSGWLNFEFIVRVTLGRKLAPWIPSLAKPLPSVLVANSSSPYSEVLEQTRWWTERVRKSQH